MEKKFINFYYDLFDKKIEDSTIVVGLIGVMIFLTCFLSNNTQNYKTNIFEYNEEINNTILVDGKKYKIIFQKIE